MPKRTKARETIETRFSSSVKSNENTAPLFAYHERPTAVRCESSGTDSLLMGLRVHRRSRPMTSATLNATSLNATLSGKHRGNTVTHVFINLARTLFSWRRRRRTISALMNLDDHV